VRDFNSLKVHVTCINENFDPRISSLFQRGGKLWIKIGGGGKVVAIHPLNHK